MLFSQQGRSGLTTFILSMAVYKKDKFASILFLCWVFTYNYGFLCVVQLVYTMAHMFSWNSTWLVSESIYVIWMYLIPDFLHVENIFKCSYVVFLCQHFKVVIIYTIQTFFSRENMEAIAKVIQKFPGNKIFGLYRFLPIFFSLGAALEFTMVKWEVNGVNFCKYIYKNLFVS